MRPVNDEEILLDLDRRSRGYGNGARLARAWGVEPAHLSDVLVALCPEQAVWLAVARGIVPRELRGQDAMVGDALVSAVKDNHTNVPPVLRASPTRLDADAPTLQSPERAAD